MSTNPKKPGPAERMASRRRELGPEMRIVDGSASSYVTSATATLTGESTSLGGSIQQFRLIFPDAVESRIREVLEATSGNVERAIELYLTQPSLTKSNPAANTHQVMEIDENENDHDEDEVMIDEHKQSSNETASSTNKKRKVPPSTATASSSKSNYSPAASPSKKSKLTSKPDIKQPSLAGFFNRSPMTTPTKSKIQSTTAASSTTTSNKASSSALPSSPVTSTTSVTATAASATYAASASNDPTTYSKDPFTPCFRPNEPVPFLFLSRIYEEIELENGRIKIINYCQAEMILDLDDCIFHLEVLSSGRIDLAAALFLSSDQLAPPYENHQLGIGPVLLSTLVSELTGASHAHLSLEHQRLGDLGLIAAELKQKQRLLYQPVPLTVAKVFQSFHALQKFSKIQQKKDALKKMFVAARESELTYLIRIAEGQLRIGSVITTVLTALAKAFVLHHLYCESVPKSEHHMVCTFERVQKTNEIIRGVKPHISSSFKLEPSSTIASTASSTTVTASVHRRLPSHLAQAMARIRRAYAELPSFHSIIPVLMTSPTTIYELNQHIHLTPGIPIKPQLGRPMTSIMQVLKLFKNMPFTVEVKYDGLRAQIHRLKDGTYRIFSRHLMDQKDRWNDLIPFMEQAIRRPEATQSFILDAEIVAVEHFNHPEPDPSTAGTNDAAAASSSSAAPSPSFRILPFQQLSTRKRGSTNGASSASNSSTKMTQGGQKSRVEVSCMVYVFDFLSLNHESLLLNNLPRRRQLLSETFNEIEGHFQFVEHVDISAESTSDLAIEEIEDEDDKKTTVKKTSKKDDQDDEVSSDEDKDDEDTNEVAKKPLKKTIIDVDDEFEMDENEEKKAADDTHLNQDDTPMTAASSAAHTSMASPATVPPISASDQISAFLNSTAIVRGEGVMAKSLSAHSTYEPDVRTDQWCKLKKDYIAGFGIADSIDVVIIGAWYGNGRKAGFLSPFLAAVYNPDTEEYESFAKIMSGFTDVKYKELTDYCLQNLVIPAPKKYYRVHESLTPQLWLEPKLVWEIRGADLTISPLHTAGIGIVHPDKGISLRFPRFIRDREDKGIDQISTNEDIAHLYRGQHGVQGRGGGGKGAR